LRAVTTTRDCALTSALLRDRTRDGFLEACVRVLRVLWKHQTLQKRKLLLLPFFTKFRD